MLIDKIEAFSHRVHLAVVAFVARSRERFLEDSAVALAYLAKKRRDIVAALDREEAVLIEDIHKVRDKLVVAHQAKQAVADFLAKL